MHPHVVARLRPLVCDGDCVTATLTPCGLRVFQGEDDRSYVLRVPVRTSTGSGEADDPRDFVLDGVLTAPAASQEEVFQKTTLPLVRSLLEGYNGTVMAYGQTGAGKSHTMFGHSGGEWYGNRGICSRAISAVFQHLGRGGLLERGTSVGISALECYNETIRDMLAPVEVLARKRWDAGGRVNGGPEEGALRRGESTAAHIQLGPGRSREDLVVHEDPDGTTTVRNLSVLPAPAEEDAMNHLFEAETNRSIAAHAFNSRSSRAHFVLTIHLTLRKESVQVSEVAGVLPRGEGEDGGGADG